ncbi:hypothetical protein ACI65C_004589 [Semiaphis heraclei]
MTCAVDKLYQLEFVVKTLTRCGRPEDESCGMAIGIRFLGNQEQMVCEIPASTDCSASTVTTVNVGNKYTFPMTGVGKCEPRSIRVAVRLHRMLGADMLPGRVELASGEMEVPMTMKPDERQRRRPPSSAGGACATDCDDNVSDDGCEMNVPMTSCHDGRTVAVLIVRARVWCIGSMMAAPIACPVPCPVSCPAPCPAPCPIPCPVPCGVQPAKCPTPCPAKCPIPCPAKCPTPCPAKCPTPCPAKCPTPCPVKCPAPCPVKCPTPCQMKCPPKCPTPCPPKCPTPCPPKCPVRCSPQPDPFCQKKPGCACDPCRKKTMTVPCCPTGCPQPRPCRRPCCPTSTGSSCPQQQYETVSCEIDGHKMDLRVRKKNFETCSVQRRIANEAEAFASRVMGVVKDMHGLIMDSSNSGGNGN